MTIPPRAEVLSLVQIVLAGIMLVATACGPVPASRTAANLTPAANPAAPVATDIPVPKNARDVVPISPTPAELQTLLRPLPPQQARAVRSVRAVVYRWPGPVTVGDIMAYYAATEAPLPPLESAVRPAPPAAVPQTGIRPLASDPGYLVVSVTFYPSNTGDARVTVARVEGSPEIARLLEDVVSLIDRTVPARRLQRVAGVGEPVFPGSLVEREIALAPAAMPLLLDAIKRKQAPQAVRELYAAIVRSAESINLTTYQVMRRITPDQFLSFYRRTAEQMNWGPVMSDASSGKPMAVFTLGDGQGIVMVQGESANFLLQRPSASPFLLQRTNVTQFVPGTRVTVLVVVGKVDLKALRGTKP